MGQLSSESPLDLLRDDFFIDEILSRLDSAKSIVRLGMVSKRFHSLCSSYPSVLQFKEVPYDLGLIKYLKKFFKSRMNMTSSSSNIKPEFQKFFFSMLRDSIPILTFVTYFLLDCFPKALSLNVQELTLQFHRKSLRTHSYIDRPELNLQYSMIPLKHLRVLTIDIPISLNESFGEWISTYCVNLEELYLSDVLVIPKRFTITSPSLRFLSIDARLEELQVASAPKLQALIVGWNHQEIDPYWRQPHLYLEVSDVPNLENLSLVMNWGAIMSEALRYSPFGGDVNNFPSLKSATVILPDSDFVSFTPDSLERLLLDIRQVKELCLSNPIIQAISQQGIMHTANIFHNLEKFEVIIKGDEEYWWEKADTITSFVKSIPSLKTFKLATFVYDHYDIQTPLAWIQNALFLNIEELDLQFRENHNMYTYHYLNIPDLMLPSSYYPLKHLRVLTLKDIPIGLNHSFEHFVSNCCLNLQELNISGAFVIPTNLTVISSSLRVFTIDADFMELLISAPKLVTLHVTWTVIYHGTDNTNQSLTVSEYSPELEDLLLSNWNTFLPLDYCNFSCDKTNFPSLRSATVLVSEFANNMSLGSLKRLLLDISHTKKLFVSDTILHKISCSGIIHSEDSIRTLEKLHVRVDKVNKNIAESIMSFVKKAPSLKTFKLTIKKGSRKLRASKKFRESLVDNIIFKLGISRPVIFFDDNKVKVVVSPKDDVTLLLKHIINKAPRDFKFIFLYQR